MEQARLEHEVAELKRQVQDLAEKVQWLDRGLKDAQLYINELNKRAGIRGGFPE